MIFINLLLRELRNEGVVQDWVHTYEDAAEAEQLAAAFNQRLPGTRSVVFVPAAIDRKRFWLVSEADAQRLVLRGYVRAADVNMSRGADAAGARQNVKTPRL